MVANHAAVFHRETGILTEFDKKRFFSRLTELVLPRLLGQGASECDVHATHRGVVFRAVSGQRGIGGGKATQLGQQCQSQRVS